MKRAGPIRRTPLARGKSALARKIRTFNKKAYRQILDGWERALFATPKRRKPLTERDFGLPPRRKPLRKRGARAEREAEELEVFRTLVLARANHHCERCGRDQRENGLHPHHRRMRSQGGSNVLSNGAALCPTCHDGVHTHTVPDYADWIVTRKPVAAGGGAR